MDGESQNAVAKASLLAKTNHKHQQTCPLISCTVSGFLLTSQLWTGATAPSRGLGAPEEAVALTAELRLNYLVFFLQICLCRIPKQDSYKITCVAVDLSEVCGSRSINPWLWKC